VAPRHLRRDPAPGRHADVEDDRRGQQGPEAPIFELADYGVVAICSRSCPRPPTRSASASKRCHPPFGPALCAGAVRRQA
jgi:hypothetical protein